MGENITVPNELFQAYMRFNILFPQCSSLVNLGTVASAFMLGIDLGDISRMKPADAQLEDNTKRMEAAHSSSGILLVGNRDFKPRLKGLWEYVGKTANIINHNLRVEGLNDLDIGILFQKVSEAMKCQEVLELVKEVRGNFKDLKEGELKDFYSEVMRKIFQHAWDTLPDNLKIKFNPESMKSLLVVESFI